jgi:hypothetical protein
MSAVYQMSAIITCVPFSDQYLFQMEELNMAADLFDDESVEPEKETPKKKFFGIIQRPVDNSSEQKPPEGKLPTLLTVLAILLFLQLAVSGFQLYRDISTEAQETARQEMINKSVATYSANLDALTTKMLDEYKTNVYNNTAVNTTAKQQVMGLEFNFNAMMLLVKQNNRLMQLIATSK